jgi:hypothetical protein
VPGACSAAAVLRLLLTRLGSLPRLLELDLSRNALGAEGAAALARALCGRPLAAPFADSARAG